MYCQHGGEGADFVLHPLIHTFTKFYLAQKNHPIAIQAKVF
jgi:hypothetical protein